MAAVNLFLNDKIVFGQIPELVEHALHHVSVVQNPTLEEILQADADARIAVEEAYQHLN